MTEPATCRVTAGVQALILKECHKALYVHCCAHSLNLAVQDATRCVSLIRDVLGLVGDLNTVVRASAKRYAIFQAIKTSISSDCTTSENANRTSLRQLYPTRWTVRATSMQSVVDNYVAIMNTLETIASNDKSESGSKAAGLFKSFHRFSTYFGLKLGVSVFERAEKLSRLLQSTHLPATDAKSAATSLIKSLRCSRQEQQFETFWTSTLSEAKKLEIDDPVLPRRSRPSVCVDSGADGVTYECPAD